MASYFAITRGNAVTDPSDNVFKYLGDLKYKGVEATVSYEITRDLKVNAASSRGEVPGPRHVAQVWASKIGSAMAAAAKTRRHVWRHRSSATFSPE